MMNSRHFNVFFATYRAFATCPSVLELLLQRYSKVEADSLFAGRAKTSALQRFDYLMQTVSPVMLEGNVVANQLATFSMAYETLL